MIRNSAKSLMTTGLLLVLPIIGSAQISDHQRLTTDSALAATLAGIVGQPLTLNEARTLAIKNSTAVLSAQALVDQARGAARRERGGFDPSLFAELIKSKTETPASSPFAGADALNEEATDLRTGVNWRLRYGTELEFSLNTNKTESNSGFASLNPQYTAFTRFNFTQPLLSGSWQAAKAPLTAAERVEEAAIARYRDAVLGTIQTVDETYWDLYAAERDLAVLQITLNQAETFLKEARTRAGAGLIGPGDVANATVYLSQQQQAELDGEENLDRVSNRLISLIGYEPLMKERRLRAVDSPERTSSPNLDPDSLSNIALDRNYVVKAAELELEATQALSKGAGWNTLPDLDLIGSIGGNGLAGEPQDVIFGTDTLRTSFSGNQSEALTQALNRDYPTWSVGLRFTLPLGMRSTKGERDRLKAQESLAQQSLIAAKRGVEEQVRNALLEYKNAEQRLTSAETGVNAARELVRIGDIDFRVGRITAFEVVRLNADLASAQLRYSKALVRATKASAALKRLTGENIEMAELSW